MAYISGVKKLDKNHLEKVKPFFGVIIALLVVFILPYKLTLKQNILLGTLIFTVFSWTTNAIPQLYASIFMLFVFTCVGNTPLREIYKFPLSSNFIIIGFSFLLSIGIVNSNIIRIYVNNTLKKVNKDSITLTWIAFIANFVFVFIIPNPFARTVILASIVIGYLDEFDLTYAQREAILLSLFISSAASGLGLLTGDFILNGAALDVGGAVLNGAQWTQWMFVPTVVIGIIINIIYIFMFKKNLDFNFRNVSNKPDSSVELETKDLEVNSKDKIALAIIVSTIVLWMLESVHKIPSTIVVVGATILMFIFGILKLKDIKGVNFRLMVFLTAAFSIGSVMGSNGITEVLFSDINIEPLLNSKHLYLIITLINMVVHMILGSAITTLSITIPSIINMSKGAIDPLTIIMISNTVVSLHYMLPFHRIVLMIGSGSGYYSTNKVIKIGLILTILIPLAIIYMYIPWWKMLNLV